MPMVDKISVRPIATGLNWKSKSGIKQKLWISLGMVAILVPANILGLSMGLASHWTRKVNRNCCFQCTAVVGV